VNILDSLPQTLALFGPFTDAFDFVVSGREAQTGGVQVGGPGQVLDLATTQLEVTLLALTVATVLALPLGLALGHFGRGEFLAVSIGNGGRAIPELALIALMAAAIGVGMVNLVVALAILGIPPILTNAYVGIRQVDRSVVEAARGMGMGNLATILRVELPLAVPLVMGGIRTSAINIVATATIAPLAGILTLGDFIIARNVYGDTGVLAGAVLVALMALTIEATLAAVQWGLTPRALKSGRAT
jgi:osmoprotectant transport system permease protein